jgi:hypothetical protein
MQTLHSLERPLALHEGKRYFLRLNRPGEGIPVLTQVTFRSYTACPGVVIVQDGGNEWLRCGREDLFTTAIADG